MALRNIFKKYIIPVGITVGGFATGNPLMGLSGLSALGSNVLNKNPFSEENLEGFQRLDLEGVYKPVRENQRKNLATAQKNLFENLNKSFQRGLVNPETALQSFFTSTNETSRQLEQAIADRISDISMKQMVSNTDLENRLQTMRIQKQQNENAALNNMISNLLGIFALRQKNKELGNDTTVETS